MSKKALLTALSKAGSAKPKVHELPKKKEPKGSDVPMSSDNMYYPPTLYLDDKDFPGVKNFESKKSVTLCVVCDVNSIEIRKANGKESHHASLTITDIADITAMVKAAKGK